MRWVALVAVLLVATLVWLVGIPGASDTRSVRRAAPAAADRDRPATPPARAQLAKQDTLAAPPVITTTRPVVWGFVSSRGEPVFSATVKAIEANGTYVAGECGTNTEGRYVLEIDRAGEYQIEVEVRAESGLSGKDAGSIPVTDGDRVRRDIEIRSGATIAGVVRGAEGSPLAGVAIAAVPLSRKQAAVAAIASTIRGLARSITRTDKDGSFVARGLRGAPYVLASGADEWIVSPPVEAAAGERYALVRMVPAWKREIEAYDAATGLPASGFAVRDGKRRLTTKTYRLVARFQKTGPGPILEAPHREPIPLRAVLAAPRRFRGIVRVLLHSESAPVLELEIVDDRGHAVEAPIVAYHRPMDGSVLAYVQRPSGVLVLRPTGPGRYRARIPEGDWNLVANERRAWGLSDAVGARVTVPSETGIRIEIKRSAELTVRLRSGDRSEEWAVRLASGRQDYLCARGLRYDRAHVVAAGRYRVFWLGSNTDGAADPRFMQQDITLAPGEKRVVQRPPG